MDVILLFIRLFLAALFAVAAIGKLLDPKGSDKVMTDFGMPKSLAMPAAYALSITEILIAALLIPASTAYWGALGACLLLLIFIAGMIYQLAKGNAPDCHCFGQIHTEPVSIKSIVRNIAFTALSVFLTARGANGQGMSLTGGNLDAVQVVFALLALSLLAAAIIYLKTIADRQREILERLEKLELGQDSSVRRDEAGDPNDGLPIGAPFPGFELQNLDGEQVSLNNLLAKAKPILFFFIGPDCNPCEALVSEIQEWRNELAEKIEIILISKGDADENSEKFEILGRSRILLEKEKEVSGIVNARWTPTALLINSSGIITSHLAAGDSAIEELIGKIKKENPDDEFVYFAQSNGIPRKFKIGENIPDFSLPDLNGQKIGTENFKGKKTLAAFMGLTCGHCIEMMDDLRIWDETRAPNEPNLIIFSTGDRDEHLELNLKSPVLLEKNYKIARQIGMFGTPSAVLVNEEGKVVTETAIGARNMWALIGKRF